MSKKFKGKTCAYCARATATTDDHGFAREFFLLGDRNYLPKAPACKSCNEAKAKYEHYLTAVLPFGGRHPQAVVNLQSGVPGRLSNNWKLNKTLLGSMRPAWLREGTGLYQQTGIVDFASSKLEGLIKFIGRGLAWRHWKLYLRPDADVSVMFMPDMMSACFKSLTGSWRNAQEGVGNLGNGTIQYMGVQAPDPPELTVWTISMYGGLVLSDDRHKSDEPIESCSMWWVITGPPELSDSIVRLKMTRDHP
ncbi:MAG: HNH endonuclease [Bryobacteraceae bacterium]